MKQIERTFFETAIRFFEPLIKNPFVVFRSFLMYGLWAIWPIIHIVFIKNLVLHIENGDKEAFIHLTILYALYNVLYELIDFLFRKWWRVELNAYRKIIHREYISKFIKLDNNEVEKLWTWKIIPLLDKWMDTWTLSLDEFIKNFISIFITFIFAFLMILSVNQVYGVIFLIIYILLHIVGGILNNYTLKYRRKRLDSWHLYVKQLVMVIMSKFEILQTSKTDNEIKKLDIFSNDMQKFNLKIVPFLHTFFRLPEWVITWMKLLIILYVWLNIFDWEGTISILVWIFWILTLMDWAIKKSMLFFEQFTKNFTAIEKMWNFFDWTSDITCYDRWDIFKYKNWEIEIKDLSYSYIKWKNVFEKLSIKIEWEKILALVWNSGGWKSTIAKLISGYITPNSGEIIIDNQKLSETSLKSYYRNIGYLTQDPSVFDGTVLDNLTYALEEKVLDEKIKEIIIQAKCEFIYDLPNGLETEIWERWVKLSGGQKQRLAIAKIFLKDPKIIILDEPTSALDSFSEEQITKAMKNLFNNRTVIVIAHRLQTVKHADRILVLENWKIIEDGNHNELVKQDWRYAKMLELQSGF